MSANDARMSKIFKALSDENRLGILAMLAESELCACKILESFDITQPTLSHHMKVLAEAGLIKTRQEGKWSHYSLNVDAVEELIQYLKTLKAC
ncbi:ArsR/SmtB family transcription factor [Candidatus Methanomassiliicoccus intestinalis]|uniref:ArsR/SmtB family transcription factor n=1 Tax=Candidatus Methanomassiliicoccus intestinalis TaxID=1406512 RepID=UPI0037DD62E0